MAGEGNEPSDYSLKHRSSGYEIFMSRGKDGEILSKTQAEALVAYTVFSLKLDEAVIEPNNNKAVAELESKGWHVVQSYSLPKLSKGTYSLVGKSTFNDMGGSSRTNTVTLTIY